MAVGAKSTHRNNRVQRRPLIAAVVIVAVIAGGIVAGLLSTGSSDSGGTPSVHKPSTAKLPSVGARSELAWNSGVYPTGLANGNYVSRVENFEDFRDRKADVALGTLQSDSWDALLAGYTIDQYKDFKGMLVLSVPMIPDGGSMSDGAKGVYDDKWRDFGRMLVAKDRPAAILRLGWEFTGDYSPWAGTHPETWKAYWRHIVDAVRESDPQALFDWNGTVNAQSIGHDPFTELWPGDDYVNFVGVDVYDSGPSRASDDAGWAKMLGGGLGLDDWYKFAKAHGKRLSIPEWGLNGSSSGGGDNTYWMSHMLSWIQDHGPSLAYEAYFNEGEDYIKNSLEDPVQMPNSAKIYQQFFKSAA
jgi:hypothetical protein